MLVLLLVVVLLLLLLLLLDGLPAVLLLGAPPRGVLKRGGRFSSMVTASPLIWIFLISSAFLTFSGSANSTYAVLYDGAGRQAGREGGAI